MTMVLLLLLPATTRRAVTRQCRSGAVCDDQVTAVVEARTVAAKSIASTSFLVFITAIVLSEIRTRPFFKNYPAYAARTEDYEEATNLQRGNMDMLQLIYAKLLEKNNAT